MTILIELEQLLKKDGTLLIDSNTKNSDKIIVFYKKGDNIPIEVFNVLHEYKTLQMVEKPADVFLYGFIIGKLVSGKETDTINLLSVKIPDLDDKYKNTGTKPVKSVVNASEDKPKRHRRTKAEMEAEREKQKETSANANPKNIPSDTSGYSQETQNDNPKSYRGLQDDLPALLPVTEKIKGLSSLRKEMLKSSNKAFVNVIKDENLFKRMVKAVKDSSDPKIGLDILLKMHLGKDLAPMVIDEVRKYYKDIKE